MPDASDSIADTTSSIAAPSSGGVLYIVPTPIGNLQDITERARNALLAAATIAAEDTRRCRKLLQLLDIRLDKESKRVVALHEHNEAVALDALVDRLARGETVALVSDAGTPLISDPGHLLLRAVWAAIDAGSDIQIVPLPGPSAVLTALSACPLPLHLFTFVGFLPAKSQARKSRIAELLDLPGAFVLFEAPHRVAATLSDLAELIGGRRVFVARELTKLHEQLALGTAEEVLTKLTNAGALRGEFVLVVEGGSDRGRAGSADSQETVSASRLLLALADELPPAQAAKIAAKVTGAPRAELYRLLQARNAGES